MKIIYDNIIFSLQKAGGISIYWIELIKRISLKNDEISFYESDNNNIFRKNIFLKKDNIERDRYAKILRYLPFVKKLPSKSIFHSSYYRTIFQKDVVKIVTVYDFTYEYYERGLVKLIHGWQKKLAIKNADGVICISNSTANDLFKFLPDTNMGKVKTIYISSGEEFHVMDNRVEKIYGSRFHSLLKKNIILYVGDRKSSYKNFELAVKTVEKLDAYLLVSVGAGEISNIEQVIIDKKLNNRFFHYLGISSQDLNILYNMSHCLLYPSSYEGFGIPILEAMKAGCPVVSTNFSSIPEVAGDAGILVDEITEKRFIHEIKKLEDEQFRRSCIEKGLIQASKFSWNKCFNETYDFYKDVYDRKFNR